MVDHVLSTFHASQSLPNASLADIETYRTYLATRNPIAEIETRFLDPAQDLVCLARARRSDSVSSVVTSDEMDMLTPMPLKTTFGFSSSPTSTAPSRKQSVVSVVGAGVAERRSEGGGTGAMQQQGFEVAPLQSGPAQIAVLLAVAVIGPVLFFPLVSDFVGRMALVLVVGVAMGAVRGRMVDSEGGEAGEGGIRGEGMKGEDVLLWAGVYAGVMAVVAALV